MELLQRSDTYVGTTIIFLSRVENDLTVWGLQFLNRSSVTFFWSFIYFFKLQFFMTYVGTYQPISKFVLHVIYVHIGFRTSTGKPIRSS